MRKSVFLSLIAVGVLYASPNSTSVKTKGLFFGKLYNAKGEAFYGKYNALLGCLHNRGGSDTMGYYDCTDLVQVYRGDNNSDSVGFRDNVWCMESGNDKLGKKYAPSKDEFARDIYNNSNVHLFNSESKTQYNTEIYKYPNKDYQESYKNLKANTTGRLLILAKNKSDYNPFSFYLTNNVSNLNSDFGKFVNNYVGLLNGKSGSYVIPSNWNGVLGLLQGWMGNINMSRAQGGTESHRNGCNYASKGYGGGLKGGDKGCGVSDWNSLNFIERYVRFYHDLTNNGCSIKPVNYWSSDSNFRDDVSRDKGTPHYGGIIDDNGKILYYRTPINVTNSQPKADELFIKEAAGYKLDRVINGNERCRQIIEEMTVKNASTYGTRDFGNASDFLFFNNENLENGNYFGKDLFTNGGIGKCYFVNLQYYDNTNSFPAITANKFLWGNQSRFLQNYLKQDGRYAIANYSIDRTNIYHGNKPGNETSIFTLNTRPTSFRDVDEKNYGNTKQGEVKVNYDLIFYPDANGSKTTMIDSKLYSRKARVENLPSNFDEKEFYVVTSLEYGVNNNAQLSFTYQGKDLDPNRIGYTNKNECNLSNGQNCGNMKFKFKDFKYNIYKLQKTDGNFKVIGEEKDKTGRFDSEYTTDFMALRVDEGLLNAIDYKDNDSILLELALDKGYYADDRPFFEISSNSIIEADKTGRFAVIISDIKFSGGNLEFGSIWDKGDPDTVPYLNGHNTGFTPGVTYTRVAGNPIFIGIKNNNPKNNLNPNDNFITFEIRDGDGHLVSDPDVSFYENGKTKVNLNHDNDNLLNDPAFNAKGTSGTYPYNNGVLKINELKVGKYKVCFNVYSKSQIQEEINKNSNNPNVRVDVPVKISDCSNVFSVRPAYAEYSTDTTFNAGENAKNGGQKANFNAKLTDSKNRLVDTNEEFGLSKTNLVVEDSKNNKYNFSLYAKNNKKISNKNEVDFVKKGKGIYTINNTIVNFPFSTNAELELFEGKFTKADSNAMLCKAGMSSNVIDASGKIGCLIPYKNPIKITFNSKKEYELKTPVLNNIYTKEKVFFKSNEGDNNSLTLAYVFNNKGADRSNGLEYVYHKFDSDQNLNYVLNFDNKDAQFKDRYLLNFDNKYVDKSTINVQSASKIEINDVLLTKEKLNKEFDTKLKDLYNSTNADDNNINTTGYGAKRDEIAVNLDLAYSKYKTVSGNTKIDKSSLLSKPNVAEFSLLSNSSVNVNGKSENLSKDYSFIFAGLTYKDNKINKANEITLKSDKDLEVYYLNKKAEREKINLGSDLYSKSTKDIVDELSFNADYGSSMSKDATNGDLTITLTPSYSKKQYVKEVVNIANTDDLNGGRFTIEFNKN